MTAAVSEDCGKSLGGYCRDSFRRRKPRNRITAKPNALGDHKPVSQRPVTVTERSEPGYWEGDLIIGANTASDVVTLVERFSRQSVLAALPHAHTANNTAKAVINSTVTSTSASHQNPHLGSRHRNGALG